MLKLSTLDDIGTLLWTNPSLSPCYSLSYEGIHGRMPGIDSSFSATLTQNSNNLGEIRVEDCPIYFKENSEYSESIKKLQRNKMSNKLQETPEKQRTISSYYKSIVSIKRTYNGLMKKINYDPLRNRNTQLKIGSKKCLTSWDSLHYGVALKQHYDRKHLMKPETLKRAKIKSYQQLDAIEKISLNSELTKKFEDFSVNLLGKLSSINSEKNDFPCYSSTDSTMHHHISKTLSAEKDKKLSQSTSKNGNKILTPDNLDMLLVHEDFIDANLGSPRCLIEKNENSQESDTKIEPIDLITSEDIIKSEDSESENSHHQEGTIEVFPVEDGKKSESHSTEYIKDVNKKRIKSIKQKTKHKQSISKLAKKTLSENPKPMKQIFIYNNSESLLNETVVPFESDCESADHSNNRIPETTSEILSAIQNIYKNSDNLLNETFNAYKSDCGTADNSNNQIAETTSKVISSTQNIYKNTKNLLNETVNAVESDCETAVNSYNQLPETTSNILSSTQSMVVGEDHYDEEIRCDSTKSQIPNRQHQEDTIEVTPVQDEKLTESHSPENKDVKKKRNKSIKHRTKHKQIISKLAKKIVSENPKQIKQISLYNHSENILNGKVHVSESNCGSADNSKYQIAETSSKIVSSIQNIYNSENLPNETGDVLESGCETADNTNNPIPETTNKILLSSQNKVVDEDHFDDEITCDSTTTQRSVEFLKNSLANNSDPKEKCCNRLSLLETCSVSDNCIENIPVESNSQSFGSCISKENRVRRTNLFHRYVNEEVPNKYVNVTIKPFEKQKDDSNVILEIDRAMETLINLRHLLTVNIIKSKGRIKYNS